jgi:hypothetical protein
MLKRELIRCVQKNSVHNFKLYKTNKLLLYPISDILGGFCFEGSATKGNFYLSYFNQPLYSTGTFIHLTFGTRLKNSKNSTHMDEAEVDDNEALYLVALINQMGEYVKKMTEPMAFYNYYRNKDSCRANIRIYEEVVHSAFWLGLPNAKEDANDCLSLITEDDLIIPWRKQLRDELILLRDHSEPRVILEQWKQATIQTLKLEKFI